VRSRRVINISKCLKARGAAWAVQAAKYCSPDDPLENQIKGRRTWHIHPDANYPHQNSIKRFDTLDQIEQWLACPAEEG